LLITQEYVAQNKSLHETRQDYGAFSHRLADQVIATIRALQAATLLDYGCGKATLARALLSRREEIGSLAIENYDPAIRMYEERPRPADLVVCTDVLEHVEPECLDNVLADLRRLTLKACFIVVATRPSSKFLPDGRNSHLIQQPAAWWLPKFRKEWTPWQTKWNKNELRTLLFPR
jgi:2-polyprenyl-3-methyl-5-hydroxy-6-metoxy-1,4-benzoquinol methylase